ncbi:endolytic transglycosylase MltG [Pleurocapsa sp. PCC 7319]|uniref:endolytic transglycosylase MltG n=1 Tax=Pleurocapsa sp. PCC 7319 TaxID=118161 RepID=UPI000345BB27|nr:endolytic transglycosylase MltG [Pleurocapsa sp. PCC 7319]
MTTQNKSKYTQKSGKKAKIIFAAIPIIIGVSLLLGWAGWRNLTAPVEAKSSEANPGKKVQFTVKPGTSGNQVGEELAQAGLIKSANGWKIWTKLKRTQDSSGGFKAGTYMVSPEESLPTIAEKIWQGEVMQVDFTIPEGWSTIQMAEYFASLGYFSADEFKSAVAEIPYDKYPWLPQDLPILEGFLYPDTYKISSDRTSNPEAIIYTMLDRFEQLALPVYEAAQPEMSLLDWVSLSSIVEKEAVIGEERALIAGVFTARLEKGMKLESDPTVEYGLGIRQTADQPLTYAQVGTPSPYNTYMNTGLTPTPIASPGIESLKATLNPESTDYLFFVARYDGTHVFSETLSEHEAATREIRRQRNQ